MTPELALIAARFFHYLACSILFGAALFPFYAGDRGAPARLSWLKTLLISAAFIALISGAAWLAFTAATMSDAFTGAFDANVLATVIGGTAFGHVWVVRLALAAGAFGLLLPRTLSPWRLGTLIAVSLALLISIAATGHAINGDGYAGMFHEAADAIHLAAAATWIGALFGFSFLCVVSVRARHDTEVQMAFHALRRFSGIGTLLVAMLIGSGVVNAWFLVGPANFLSRPSTFYGEVLWYKLGLMTTMLALAALNRFHLTPALAAALGIRNSLESQLRSLRLSLIVETTLGVAVLAAVAWLGTLAPPGLD